MIILITKDGATKVPREVSTVAEVEAVIASGFCVEQALGDGESRVLTLEEAAAALEQEFAAKPPPAEPQQAEQAAAAPAPAAKAVPAKKAAAKTATKR